MSYKQEKEAKILEKIKSIIQLSKQTTTITTN